MSRVKSSWVDRAWYGWSWITLLLLPFSWLYAGIVAIRRFLYARKLLPASSVSAPVVVVGNVSAGGTGKTPVTVWLVKRLREKGLSPGIVSRGYRGNTGPSPVRATVESDPNVVGDEAVLLAKQSACPVVVHPDRVAATNSVIDLGANIVISDDGLQHYRLERDIEIAVVDADRRFGNGQMLPAGPLREPESRLRSVDVILLHRKSHEDQCESLKSFAAPQYSFWLDAESVKRLDESETRHLSDFAGKAVHAVAGIGNPERFFSMLESHNVEVHRHPFPDHAEISQGDLVFEDGLDVLMTEKDAVKCRWPEAGRCWYVAVEVVVDDVGATSLLDLIREKTGKNGRAVQ